MKTLHYLIICICLVALNNCHKQKPKPVQKFQEDKPLAVEVTRVRSYYHALNIKDRVEGMGLKPYIIASQDSVAGGKWYAILVGAQKDSVELNNLQTELKTGYHFDSLRVVDYCSTKSKIVEIVEEQIQEKKQIDAEKPALPEKFYQLIGKFPRSNMFFVERMYVFGAPEKKEEKKMMGQSEDVQLDLPRGITKKLLFDISQCFAEVIYKDNIYGDRVTLDIIRLKPDHGISNTIVAAGLVPVTTNKDNQMAIASYFADLILATGDYITEEKIEFAVPGTNNLVGYRTIIQPDSAVFRTYLILVDAAQEYVLICQSTEKSEKDLYDILSLVGKSNGMIEYEEFYNTFYTLPSKLSEDDIFIGFYIDRLDWDYAKSKDYQQWAKECVGHWAAHGMFYNKKRGHWSYGIYDLLTEEKVVYWDSLYSSRQSEGKRSIKVYGKNGFLINEHYIDYDNWTLVIYPTEVNFTIDRFICMVDNYRTGDTWLTKEQLVERAESFQFQKGGYQVLAEALPDSARQQ